MKHSKVTRALRQFKEAEQMKTRKPHWRMASLVAVLLGAGSTGAADPPAVRATLQPVTQRRPAPAFTLIDAAGKKVKLSDYHGKVLLLNFWATECGGCRVEIPYFIEFAQAYKNNGLAVVGVFLDVSYENLKNSDEGWIKIKPFVRTYKVNYPILMGNDQVMKRYDIQALPLTYLIDRQGRIAATYTSLVDKRDVETNIKTLLVKP
jgi:thiol-disulfide isomerase/thioredoxin